MTSGWNLSNGANVNHYLHWSRGEKDHTPFHLRDESDCYGKMKPEAGKAAGQNNPGQVLSDQRLIIPFIFVKLDSRIEQENINNHPLGEDNLMNETWPLDKSIYAFPANVETETIDGYGI